MIEDYTLQFDSFLNSYDSLLNNILDSDNNVIDLISGISAEILKGGIFGAFNRNSGVEFGIDIVNKLSYLQSANFVSGSAGWRIDSNGDLEATSGTFRGTLSAASGTLGAITIGTNAWHIDSSGNMWWGTSENYAGATVRISTTGTANLSVLSVTTLTGTTMRSNDEATGTRIDLLNSSTSIQIRDANTDIIFKAQGEGFTNGILELNTYTNNKRALYCYTKLVTATVETAYMWNEGLSETLVLQSTNASNTDPVLKILNTSGGDSISIVPRLTIAGAANTDFIRIDFNSTSGTSQSFLSTYAGLGSQGNGITEIQAENASFAGNCLRLYINGGGTTAAHILLEGDPNPSSSADGQLWFDGTDLKMNIGGTVYKLNKTAV